MKFWNSFVLSVFETEAVRRADEAKLARIGAWNAVCRLGPTVSGVPIATQQGAAVFNDREDKTERAERRYDRWSDIRRAAACLA